MKFILGITRFFVSTLFIISGLIKLNDPLGFSYKLEEYFSETVFNMPFLVNYSLSIALFLVILEVVLGVMLLLGYKTKFTIYSLLIIIVFFTFLTFYSAYFNVVKDCGCFGDALHLTPWQSFEKDLVLLLLILLLFFNKTKIKPFFNNRLDAFFTLATIVLCFWMANKVLNHLPIKDFRPYKVGTNIQKAMEIPENAPKKEIEMIFVYKVNGVNKEFSEKELEKIPANATFVERKDKIINEGYTPPIHDFTIEKDGGDYKEEFLKEPKLLLIISYSLEKANQEGLSKMEKIKLIASSKGYKVIGVTASLPSEIERIKKQYGLTFDFYFCDAIALKTIERANPNFVILNNGTIKQKVHYNDVNDLKF